MGFFIIFAISSIRDLEYTALTFFSALPIAISAGSATGFAAGGRPRLAGLGACGT
jgi:hypothetical protein